MNRVLLGSFIIAAIASGLFSGCNSGNCADVDLSTYDRSCGMDSDCMLVATGKFCDGDCACESGAINTGGKSRYEAAIAGVDTTQCPCPNPGTARCVQGRCTRCLGPDHPTGCP